MVGNTCFNNLRWLPELMRINENCESVILPQWQPFFFPIPIHILFLVYLLSYLCDLMHHSHFLRDVVKNLPQSAFSSFTALLSTSYGLSSGEKSSYSWIHSDYTFFQHAITFSFLHVFMCTLRFYASTLLNWIFFLNPLHLQSVGERPERKAPSRYGSRWTEDLIQE